MKDKQKTMELLNELITNMDRSFNLYLESVKLYDELNVRISPDSISKLSKKMQALNDIIFTCRKVRDYLHDKGGIFEVYDLLPEEPSPEEKDLVNELLKEYSKFIWESGHPDRYIPEQIKD